MSEMVAELSDSLFEQQVIQGGDTYLVDFWAPWCGPCRIVAPIVDELAKDYEGKIKVGKINVDDNQQVAARFGISSIPTLMIFKGGELKERITGAVPKATLKQAIDKTL
jgi:thioredoxin 1